LMRSKYIFVFTRKFNLRNKHDISNQNIDFMQIISDGFVLGLSLNIHITTKSQRTKLY